MTIYFIQEELDGPIKIGQTGDVVKRLAILQVGCPRQLKVLFCFEVPDEKANYVETHIHQCFKNKKMRGEWYLPCPYLYDYIKRIKDKGFFVNPTEDEEEYIAGDKFSLMYNQIFWFIEETKQYGDQRRIVDLEKDLTELLVYLRTGHIGEYDGGH